MQAWQKSGFDMYAKRIPADIILNESLISKKINKQAKKYIIALDRKGNMLSSIAISKRIEDITQYCSHIVFNIGASEGLSQESIAQADECWSLSSLTFLTVPVKIIEAP